jgi:chromosome segregation ATPase
MSSEYDPAEFVDRDFQAQKTPYAAPGSGGGAAPRAPTREEVDAELMQKQQQLAAILREKEEKERERAALEETRRRQMEFQTGREEAIQNLTRGLGLLEEAEFSARRDAEQMAKTIVGIREALSKVQAIHEETWTKDNFAVELTRALTTLENARMEWNAARLKFAVLSGERPAGGVAPAQNSAATPGLLGQLSFGELFRVGLALTWPLVAVGLLTLTALLLLLARR